jgi:hypothetical protein
MTRKVKEEQQTAGVLSKALVYKTDDTDKDDTGTSDTQLCAHQSHPVDRTYKQGSQRREVIHPARYGPPRGTESKFHI